MKILCVENGSVDIDNRFETDLISGKVLIYRQGAKPPYVLDIDTPDFVYKKMWEELKDAYIKAINFTAYNYSAHDIITDMRDIEKKYLGDK